MLLDPDTCYRAIQARDARFDGRFFVGVSSTGIYCRPICTVRPPQRKNCSFHGSAAAAEAAGFRPCLRCRPELAPGNASIDAAQRLAHAAARLIEDGAAEAASVAALARRIGVSDRHLRRVFASEFGVAPVAYAQTQRLLLAKRLLTDTALPVTEVALASGFASVRRFNALFQERYRLSPSALRKSVAPPLREDALQFELGYRPPYDWDYMQRFLGGRSILGVEEVGGDSYRRTVAVSQGERRHVGWVELAPHPRRAALRLTVSSGLTPVLPAVLARAKHLMDLSCSPLDVAQALGALAAAHPGVRVPGAFDGFEVAVRAVLGQQISVAAARTLAGRFAAAFGTPLTTPFAALTTVFPAPPAIAGLPVEAIASLGVIGARARSILALAQALVEGRLLLAPGAEIETTLAQLRALPGIGEWTAHYIAMRALAWPDAFPHTDLGVMKALGESKPQRVLAAGAAWQPWRAYAVMQLWRTLEAKEKP